MTQLGSQPSTTIAQPADDPAGAFGRPVHLDTIQALVSRHDAVTAVREVLRRIARGEVDAPPGLGLRSDRGEIHVKGAAVAGARYIGFKVSTGFPGNPASGLPMTDGFTVALDSRTGVVRAVLADHSWLTELRTGAAGALAADLLARDDATVVSILGAGGQARFQLEALAEVRTLDRVLVWARRREQSSRYAEEMSHHLGLDVQIASSIREAAEAAEILVTTTSSEEPLVHAEWLRPGTHVTAMGSDFPHKQELDVDVLARADVIVADDPGECAANGEIHHALGAGVIDARSIISLPDLVAGTVAGRTDPEQITVVDQCGLGAYDTAMAELVCTRLFGEGSGR